MMLPSVRKKQPSTFFSLRFFSLFRIVIGILLSAHILLHLRHSHIISLTGEKHALGDNDFDTGAGSPPSRFGAAAKLVGSFLPKTRAGNAVPKSAQSRRALFGDLLNVVSGGKHASVIEEKVGKGRQAVTKQGEVTSSPLGTEAEKAGSQPDAQNGGGGTGSSNDPQEEAAGVEGGGEETVTDPLREEASQGGDSEGGQTDPPREDPLMRVLSPEDNQELEQVEGTLEYEIYVAERAAARELERERREEPSEPVSTVKHCFGGGCASSGTSKAVKGEVPESASGASQGSDAVVKDEQASEKQEKDGADFVPVDERQSGEGRVSEEREKEEKEAAPVDERQSKDEQSSELQKTDGSEVTSVNKPGEEEPVSEKPEPEATSEETVEPGSEVTEKEDVQTGKVSKSAEETPKEADSKAPVDAKPEIFEQDGAVEKPLSSDDVRDPKRRRALLQRKIDEQLAPYKKGGFTFADVAAQKQKNRMSTHFIIEPGNITLIKDPDELSDNWSYWFRADQVRQIFQKLSQQGRIPDHVEIVVNIEASPRLPRSEGSPDLPPVLSYCSTADHYDLIGVGYQYHRCLMKEEYLDGEMCNERWDPEAMRKEHPWGERKGTALWRGSPTGGLYRIEDWKEKPRSRLVIMSKRYPELLDAMFTPCSDGQCTKDGAAAIGEELGYADRLANFTDYVHHKYLVDIDGESWSSRFFQLLSSGATVFKQSTHYREFSDFFFEAGTHYERYAKDLGDLLPLLQGAEGRQEELRAMGERSLALVEQLVKDDVILEYLGMLLTSYTELFAKERAASDS